jgi:hypothetical protein
MGAMEAGRFAQLGSLGGGMLGRFEVPVGVVDGQELTVPDTGIGPNSQVIMMPQGTGGGKLNDSALTAVNPGVGFSLTVLTNSGALGAGIPCSYLRIG